MRLILSAIGFLILRAAYFSYYLYLAVKYEKIFHEYLSNEKAKSVTGYKSQIKHLMKVAGTSERYMPIVKPLGYGKLASMKVSAVDNIANLQEDVVYTNLALFEEAKGSFRNKIVQTFNPIFWLEFVLSLLPKTFIYLGLKPDSVFIKLAQVIWWLITAASVIVGIFFNKEFTAWFSKLI